MTQALTTRCVVYGGAAWASQGALEMQKLRPLPGLLIHKFSKISGDLYAQFEKFAVALT